MPAGTETLICERWLFDTLSADPTLVSQVNGRMYGHLAPPEADTPFVVWTAQGPRDIRGVGTVRIMTMALYVVKAVGTGRSFLDLEGIAWRIDAVLHGATGQNPDGLVLGCVREEPVSYVEVDGGTEYRHLGGLYRLWAQG